MDAFHRLDAEVASLGDRPFIVLLDQNGADQANRGAGVREDPDDVRPSFDSPVESFQWIPAVELTSVFPGEQACARERSQLRLPAAPRSAPAPPAAPLPEGSA